MVAPAQRSKGRQAQSQDQNDRRQSAGSQLPDPACRFRTVTKNTMEVKKFGTKPARFEKLPRLTPLQQRAFDLLGVKLTV